MQSLLLALIDKSPAEDVLCESIHNLVESTMDLLPLGTHTYKYIFPVLVSVSTKKQIIIHF